MWMWEVFSSILFQSCNIDFLPGIQDVSRYWKMYCSNDFSPWGRSGNSYLPITWALGYSSQSEAMLENPC